MSAFVFLCDSKTEAECLKLRVVGTTQANALWAVAVQPGDTLFLYNFHTGIIYGPLTAISRADSFQPDAWGGQFPVQVVFAEPTSKRSFRAADVASAATVKALRRGGPLTSNMEKELGAA